MRRKQQSGGLPPRRKDDQNVGALAALYQAERADNQVILNMSLALLGAGLVYIVSTLGLGERFGSSVSWLLVALMPSPLWLIISFQSLLFAAGATHAVSTLILENALFERTGLAWSKRGLIGILVGEEVFNVSKAVWQHRVATIVTYGGIGATFTAYTAYMVSLSWTKLHAWAWPMLGLYVGLGVGAAWSWIASSKKVAENWENAGLNRSVAEWKEP